MNNTRDDGDLIVLMDKMVDIIDSFRALEEQCPEVLKAPVYQKMVARRNELIIFMKRRTKEMKEMSDQIELRGSLGNIDGDNN